MMEIQFRAVDHRILSREGEQTRVVRTWVVGRKRQPVSFPILKNFVFSVVHIQRFEQVVEP